MTEDQIQEIIDQINSSRKYRQAGLNPTTLSDLITQEARHHPTKKALIKAVRRKLHNIVAPYLGEPEYQLLQEQLLRLDNPINRIEDIKPFCQQALSAHASTKERIPHLTEFYEQLYARTGVPGQILDLACGMHPFGLPWMKLPDNIQYHAYDIIQPRVNLINQFFQVMGLPSLAENRDVLVNPPQKQADLGLFFKEAHRFEKRQPGSNKNFWNRLNVNVLAVSLPVSDLAGTHSMLEQHRQLVMENLPDNHRVEELIIQNEIIFLIRKETA